MLAIPQVLALAERATVAAVAGALDVEAVLERVAGRRLQFAVRLRDADRLWPAATSPGW